jgi:diacylglycerol kinase family enzyme
VQITVLFNSAAGTKQSKDLPSRLTDLFDAAGLRAQIVSLASVGDATGAARAAAQPGTVAVVAAGGDGTVSSVAAGLVGSNTPLAVLPIGTLNHFAKDLGIPLDLDEAVRTIVASRVMSIDVGEVNDRIFLNNSSIGIYPSIVVERDVLRRRGYAKWTAVAVASARVLRHYRGLDVTIASGDAARSSRTPFLFVGNNEYQTDGIRLGGRERLDGGRLFAYLAPRARTRDLPLLLALALVGRAGKQQAIELFPTVDLRVETSPVRTLRVAVDGEVMRMNTPLHYRVRPRALRVLVPAR